MGRKAAGPVPARGPPPARGTPRGDAAPLPLLAGDSAPGAVRTLSAFGVFACENFLTAGECAELVAWSQAAGFEEVSHAATRNAAFRSCGRIQRQSPELAEGLWRRLAPLLPPDLAGAGRPPRGCNPNIRIYRYARDDAFGKHVDESSAVGDAVTEATVLVYLNSSDTGPPNKPQTRAADGPPSCAGGATVFHEPAGARVSFSPRLGAVLFHVHGDRCLEHEGAAVTAGSKFVLRTDVLYDTPPKRRRR
ncbi:hypothetical protein M885DRAFT_517117 [Pelagophyceae sp. CCMP2097]|nr:hypothetical protein M885DRAFT_517117 [Pelagophyceae sp. CCMP2097]